MNIELKSRLLSTKHKTKFQQLLFVGALLGGAVCSGVVVADEQQPYGKLSKQLDIMNNILISSLKSQQVKSLKATQVDSLYLAEQGVVFTVKSANSSAWSHHGFSFSFPDDNGIVAPVAPVAPVSGDFSFEFFDDSGELVEQIELAYEQQREHAREFREQQRDLAYDLRDLERENRDLEYQLRNVNEEAKSKIVKEQKAIKEQKAELEQKRVALSKKSKEMKKQQKLNQSKKLAQRKDHFQNLTRTLVETLCTYGNSLKELPKDEHVSLVLKSAGSKVGRNYQDKVIILTKRNITDCAIDKISTEKLLASMKSYQF